MAKRYSDEERLKAKVMWLSGNFKSDKAIARVLGLARSETIKDWRRRGNWEAERAATQAETQRKVEGVLAESAREMERRHVLIYQGLQSKGVHALAKADPKTVSDAVNLLDTGVKGERLVKGEPTEIREIRGVLVFNIEIVAGIVGEIVQEFLRGGRLKREDAKVFAEALAERINRAPFRYELSAPGQRE